MNGHNLHRVRHRTGGLPGGRRHIGQVAEVLGHLPEIAPSRLRPFAQQPGEAPEICRSAGSIRLSGMLGAHASRPVGQPQDARRAVQTRRSPPVPQPPHGPAVGRVGAAAQRVPQALAGQSENSETEQGGVGPLPARTAQRGCQGHIVGRVCHGAQQHHRVYHLRTLIQIPATVHGIGHPGLMQRPLKVVQVGSRAQQHRHIEVWKRKELLPPLS